MILLDAGPEMPESSQVAFGFNRAKEIALHISRELELPLEYVSCKDNLQGINRDTELIIAPNVLHHKAYENSGPLVLIDAHNELYLSSTGEMGSADWAHYYLKSKGDIHLIIPEYESEIDFHEFVESGNLPENSQGQLKIYSQKYGSTNKLIKLKYINNDEEEEFECESIFSVPLHNMRVTIDDDFAVLGKSTMSDLLSLVSNLNPAANTFELFIEPEGKILLGEYIDLVKMMRS